MLLKKRKQNGNSAKEKNTFSAAGDYHETPVNPKQKDTLFRMIFHEKEELLSLYNAVNGTSYSDILTKFLTKYRNEAIRMSIFECDIERELKLIRQDEFDAGLSQGRTEGLTEGFSQAKDEGIRYLVDAFRDYGHTDEEIKSVIIAKYQLSEKEAASYL